MSIRLNDDIRITDVMLTMGNFPVVSPTTYLKQALEEMGKRRLGIICICDSALNLNGIVTDGDIRRKLIEVQKPFSAFFSDDVIDHAIVEPVTVHEDTPLTEAVKIMGEKEVWDIPVVNHQNVLQGLLHLHPVVKALMK